MPFDPQPKDSGDLIRADDWNDAMDEIKRLETNKVTVTTDGRVGIGTASPDAALHVRGGAQPVVKIQSSTYNSISARLALRQSNERGADLYFDGRDGISEQHEAFVIATKDTQSDGIADQERLVVELQEGYVGIGLRNPKYLLHLEGGAYSDGRKWSYACSRDLKADVADLDLDVARATVSELNPVTFRYRKGDGNCRVGFIAEDVPDLVAEADRKGLSPMDILAVVTRVVQDQQREIEELRAQVAALAGSGAD